MGEVYIISHIDQGIIATDIVDSLDHEEIIELIMKIDSLVASFEFTKALSQLFESEVKKEQEALSE